MNSKLSRNNYAVLVASSLFLIAVTISTIYDLNINIMLNNKDSTFAYIFKVFAEIPAFILLPFCTNIFAISLFKTRKALNIIFSTLLSVMSVVFWYVTLDKFLFAEFLSDTSSLIVLLISIFLSYFSLYLMSFIKENTFKKLLKLALLIFISIVVTALITHIIKLIFGRVRFRDLDENYANFTNWYIINGYTGNKSFVSGHTSAAGTMFILNYLPNYFYKTTKLKPLFMFISFFYVAISGLSRIIIGAHYLSDVLFGALLSYMVIHLTNSFILKKFKHKNINN